MKCLEKLIKDIIVSSSLPAFDLLVCLPTKSLYRGCYSILHQSLKHLEERNTQRKWKLEEFHFILGEGDRLFILLKFFNTKRSETVRERQPEHAKKGLISCLGKLRSIKSLFSNSQSPGYQLVPAL